MSHHRIAKELGLSSGWVRKIIRERRPSLSPEKKELLNNLFKLATQLTRQQRDYLSVV